MLDLKSQNFKVRNVLSDYLEKMATSKKAKVSVIKEKILQRYVKENNLCLVKEYVDDGISGTTFDRPSFNELLQDIENKTIDMVITKDLSRLVGITLKLVFIWKTIFLKIILDMLQ